MTEPYQPQPGQQPAAPAKAKKAKSPRKWPWILGIFVAFGIGAAVGSGGGSTPTTTAAPAAGAPHAATVTQTVTAAAPAPAPAAAAPANPAPAAPAADSGPKTSFGDGAYLVGTDIAAGSYKTSGPRAGSVIPNCYFSRAKDDTGSLSSIEQNDNTAGSARVTVKKGEYLTVAGCDWAKA
jgi:hypothetical protein